MKRRRIRPPVANARSVCRVARLARATVLRLVGEPLEDRRLLSADLGLPRNPMAPPTPPAPVIVDQDRYALPDEAIVSLSLPDVVGPQLDFRAAPFWRARWGLDDQVVLDQLWEDATVSGMRSAVVQLRGAEVETLFDAVSDDPLVDWVSANYAYPGDPRELTPSDPSYAQQYHHVLTENDLAWDVTLGDPGIVVAVTDDGVDLDHEDLVNRIWTNAGEVPDNGVDDDGNGFVDDVHGWDFVDADNDPRPGTGANHGTHVAGIVAAETNNGIGVAGVAGAVSVMPLRFYDPARPSLWTSSVVAQTFAYAADNGAHIVSTSYNIDRFVDDPVFVAGLDYLYDQGVLHFNSAGNGNTADPPRVAFEQTLLVANTNELDERYTTSNYGEGIDVSAPGFQILSTIPGSRYGTLTGTSMAAPNAAGVAALIWSEHPDWSREQVAAQLLGSTTSIEAANPSLAGQLGAGRVNAHQGLTETLPPPQLVRVEGLPEDQALVAAGASVDAFVLEFDQRLDPTVIAGLGGIDLRHAGFDGQFDTADDGVIAVALSAPYRVGSEGVSISIVDGPLGVGNYRLQLTPDEFVNPFGTAWDPEGDGSPGGATWERQFEIERSPARAQVPLGSLIYGQEATGAIASAAEVDRLPVEVEAGGVVSVRIVTDGAWEVSAEWVDPQGIVRQSGTSVDGMLTMSSLSVDAPGTYEVWVRAVGTGTGAYTAETRWNAVWEAERMSGENDTVTVAQSLSAAGTALGEGVEHLAVIGQVSADDVDNYAISLEPQQPLALWVSPESVSVSLTRGDGLPLDGGPWAAGAPLPALVFDEAIVVNVQVSGAVGEYQIMALKGAEWEQEDDQATVLPSSSSAVVGWVAEHGNGSAEPDEGGGVGIRIDEAYDGVTLSNSLGGGVYAATANYTAPTGSLVFAPSPTSDSGWSERTNVLRADFDLATDFVAIDVGSDDHSDIAFLRAYNAYGELLEQRISGPVARDQFETLTIQRTQTDIAYVLASGLDTDITPLDRLRFGNPGGADRFHADVNAGDALELELAALGAGDNGWNAGFGGSLQVEVFAPSGASLGIVSEAWRWTASERGRYAFEVSTSIGAGEYLFRLSGVTGQPNRTGDFNEDDSWDCHDLDQLTGQILAADYEARFDLNQDGALDLADRDEWLAAAGTRNGLDGAYLLGDANLDGSVDLTDFNLWNVHKFTPSVSWCAGDFTGDGVVDASDFNLWNLYKYSSI